MCTCGCSSLTSQHPLWSQLIKDYQEQGLLVEGPLSNLRRNDMHLPKPSKLYNTRNPVSAGRPPSMFRQRMSTHVVLCLDL